MQAKARAAVRPQLPGRGPLGRGGGAVAEGAGGRPARPARCCTTSASAPGARTRTPTPPHYWEQCVQAGGDEGRAAALALADMRLKGPNPETALEMFARVVDRPQAGRRLANPLIDRAAVVKLFQEAGKTYLDNHQYEQAVRLAEPFARVAAPGEADVLRARASAEWARARREEAKQAAAPRREAGRRGAPRATCSSRRPTAYAAGGRAGADRPGARRVPLAQRPLQLGGPRPGAGVGPAGRGAARSRSTEEQRKQDWYVQRQGEAWYLLGEARRALEGRLGAPQRPTASASSTRRPSPTAPATSWRMAAEARGDLDERRKTWSRT